jgi:GT2 family glycosyltransferase
MFCRQSILLDVNGFDTRYFLHFEDADLGRKFSSNNNIITYLPSVIIRHIWGRETHKSFAMFVITIKSGIKYLIKWKLYSLK